LIGFGIGVAITLIRIHLGNHLGNIDRNFDLAVALVKECTFFVLARTIFQIIYVLGFPGIIRTTVWAFGWMCVLQLYILNATH